MKTTITILSIAALIAFTNTSNAQAIFVNDADIFLSEEVELTTFGITDVNVKSTNNGIVFQWEAFNQLNVARFEIQISEDNMNFYTVNRTITQATAQAKYHVELNNTVILSNIMYYRIKTVNANGESLFTNSYQVKIK